MSATLLVLSSKIQIVGLNLLLGERQRLRVQKVVHRASIAVGNRVFVVAGRFRFFLFLQVHLNLLQIVGIFVCRDLEAELNGLLGNESSASQDLTTRSVMLRDIRGKEPGRIVDVLVGVLLVDLVALDFGGVLFAAQSANAARLGPSAPLARFLHQSLNISCFSDSR